MFNGGVHNIGQRVELFEDTGIGLYELFFAICALPVRRPNFVSGSIVGLAEVVDDGGLLPEDSVGRNWFSDEALVVLNDFVFIAGIWIVVL